MNIKKVTITALGALLCSVLMLHMQAGSTYGSPDNLALLARSASVSVVLVMTYDETGGTVSQGSGFIAGTDGSIATNIHVLEGASAAVAKFSDGSYYEVEGILALHCAADLAVMKLKTSKSGFPVLPLADSESVKAGDPVFCISNPLASSVEEVTTEGTLSEGIISGVRTRGEEKIRVFQTTAPISSGSSGGPLLNEKGQVIGVMTFGIAMGQNLNFAVSIDHLKPLLEGDRPLPIKEMMLHCMKTEARAPQPDQSDPISIEGTYSGTWNSNVFNASGSIIVKVMVNDDQVTAKAMLTGSPIGLKESDLSGKVNNFSEGIWIVDLRAAKLPLEVRAIFKDNTFIGDYRLLLDDDYLLDNEDNEAFPFDHENDRGQWKLKR